MFNFIDKIFRNTKIINKNPFTKEYRQGYNKNWIQALKEW
jgi:hypothetical protein